MINVYYFLAKNYKGKDNTFLEKNGCSINHTPERIYSASSFFVMKFLNTCFVLLLIHYALVKELLSYGVSTKYWLHSKDK